MAPRTTDTSLRTLARITGVLFLVMAAGGFAGFGLTEAMIVPGDAAATASRLLARGGRFQGAFLGYLVAFLCDVPVAVLLYLLLRPASRTLALLAAAFRLVYAAVATAGLLVLLGARLLLDGGLASAFSPAQLDAAALFSLGLSRQGFSLALIVFAVHLVLLGLALLRAPFLPRFLGVLVAIAGVAYFVDGTSALLLSALHAAIAPLLAVPMTFELVLAFWLLVKGVDEAAVPREA